MEENPMLWKLKWNKKNQEIKIDIRIYEDT